jgi:hypothetical protein
MSTKYMQTEFKGDVITIMEKFDNGRVKFSRTWGKAPIDHDWNWDIVGHGKLTRNSCGTLRKWHICQETGNNVPSLNSCYKRTCPVCFSTWAKRQAGKWVEKYRAYSYKSGNKLLSHIILSPYNQTNFGIEELHEYKKKFTKKFDGGSWVFHSH